MIIELEDGRKVELPDGSSSQEIDDVVSHVTMASPSQPAPVAPTAQPVPVQPQRPKPTGAESIARGFVDGGSFGWGDEIMGRIGAGYARLVAPELFDADEDLYKQARDNARMANADSQAAHPWLYGGGQVAGAIGTGMKIPLPGSTAGKYAAGAGIGAVSGYGSSNSDTAYGQIKDTAMGAGLGVAGTYLGNKVGQAIASTVSSRAGQAVKDSTQNLLKKFYVPSPSAEGVAATQAVKNPLIVEAMRNGASPEEAAILAKAKQFNVPLSRGDVVRTPQQQGMEDLALRGALGDEAASTARGFRGQQEQSLRDAAKNMTTQMSGQPYADNLADIGGTVGTRLKTLESANKQAVDQAYTAVRDAGDAKIATPFINKHLKTAFDELGQYPLDTMPSTRSVMDRAGKVFMENPGGQFTAPADLAKIDNFRKFINRASSSVQIGNNSDKAGLQIIKNKLDGAIDDAIEQNLVVGNPKAINQLKMARETAQQYFQRWKADDAIQKIVENDFTPESVVNLVRGYGQTGGNKQAAELVNKLADTLGKDSPEFGMMKQAQLRQIFGKNLDSLLTGDISKGFSAEEVNKNLSTLIRNNKSLTDAYFKPEEIQVLKDYLEIAYRATNRVPGAVNYSNTTPALIRWGRQFANQFGALGRLVGAPAELVGQGMSGIKRGADAQEAINSFSPQFRNPNNPFAVALKARVTGATSAAGASLAGQQAGSKPEYNPYTGQGLPEVNLPRVQQPFIAVTQ